MEREFEGRAGAIIANKGIADDILRDRLVSLGRGFACCNTDGNWVFLYSGSTRTSAEFGDFLSRSDQEWMLLAPGFGRVLTTVNYGRPSPKPRSAWESVPMARQGSICPECDCDCDDDCDCDYCDSCECESW